MIIKKKRKNWLYLKTTATGARSLQIGNAIFFLTNTALNRLDQRLLFIMTIIAIPILRQWSRSGWSGSFIDDRWRWRWFGRKVSRVNRNWADELVNDEYQVIAHWINQNPKKIKNWNWKSEIMKWMRRRRRWRWKRRENFTGKLKNWKERRENEKRLKVELKFETVCVVVVGLIILFFILRLFNYYYYYWD
jgi:hypothetical protein